MEYDNEESIIQDESIYPQNSLRKSLYGNVEVNVKEEIEVKEEPININSVEISIAKETVICDKRIAFPLGSHLVKHGLTHTEKKSYQCSIRDETLSQNCLIKHEIVHTRDKPYQCCQCDKIFTCKSSL
ncbi:unnamed protein product, partial [Meganyctiphanes norvegica]